MIIDLVESVCQGIVCAPHTLIRSVHFSVRGTKYSAIIMSCRCYTYPVNGILHSEKNVPKRYFWGTVARNSISPFQRGTSVLCASLVPYYGQPNSTPTGTVFIHFFLSAKYS